MYQLLSIDGEPILENTTAEEISKLFGVEPAKIEELSMSGKVWRGIRIAQDGKEVEGVDDFSEAERAGIIDQIQQMHISKKKIAETIGVTEDDVYQIWQEFGQDDVTKPKGREAILSEWDMAAFNVLHYKLVSWYRRNRKRLKRVRMKIGIDHTLACEMDACRHIKDGHCKGLKWADGCGYCVTGRRGDMP